jgi:alpha-L-rhamnosidase
MAGWFTFTCNEPKGKKISVDCAELMQEGEFYRENLRTAKAMLTYTSKGEKVQVRPHFTFFGFRYLRVSGLSNIEEANVTALPFSSVTERTGTWETSDLLVNRLIENVRWSQLSNFIDVPTDCPQRDERMGWTGDTQIFSATACYQYDSAAFYAKYMQDVWLEQQVIGGSVPFIVPFPKVDLMPGARQSSGSCAWSDVATILPWTLYQFYGDKTLLQEEYKSMKAWVDFIRTQESEEHLWESGFHFADWLALDNPNPGTMGKTDPYYCASGYYYYSTLLVSKAATALGHENDAQCYESLAKDIKTSFCKKYFDEQGNCIVDTQTAHVLALMFDLCDDKHRDNFTKRLHQKLEENQMHLDTGFVGTGYLCKVLAKSNLQQDAVSLLLQKDMPGWLYQVLMGATTIWERWNSIMPDGTINAEGMNSLNHYANGAVCQWIYEDLCGISPEEPGFKKVVFAPKVDERFSYAKGTFDSAMGTYKCGWEKTEEGYTYFIHVPFDCSAVIRIPGCKDEEVLSGTYEYIVNC